MNSAKKVKASRSTKVFNVISYTFVAFVALCCLIPFIIMVSGSFTEEEYILRHGFNFIPGEFSTAAYEALFKNPTKMLRAFGISVLITVIGTCLGTFITAMAAYVLGRKDFRYRNGFSFFFYFTTLFSGGMLSSYIVNIRYLHLKNSLWMLIFANLFSVFYLMVMRSFVSAIPYELIESAKLDGAGEIRTFLKIVMPLLSSGLASVALLKGVVYWNDWYTAMLYITESKKYPLQYLLNEMLSKQQAVAELLARGEANVTLLDLPSESLKMAMAVVTMAPIMFLYPFLQKYFLSGLTIGSVKG